MSRPDFFIVGAPKSGTTALWSYLAQHPAIFMSARKEPQFFGGDLTHRFTPRLTEEEYLDLFSQARADQLRGEASTRYLQSRLAPDEIRAFNPGARIIVMLRNPVEMMYSLHAQLLFTGIEDIGDFGEALIAEADRVAGRRIPAGANLPESLQYRWTAAYADHLQRWRAAFGADRVHVIVYDDFAASPATEYARALAFLGVDDSFRPTFEVVNASRVPRSRFLRSILASPPGWMRRILRATVPRTARNRLYHLGLELNARRGRRPPMDPALRTTLTAEFQPQIERLATMLGRDLSGWWAPVS